MRKDGAFELTKQEHEHLKILWGEAMTVAVLRKCLDEFLDTLKNQLVTATLEQVPRLQAQIATANAFYMTLEKTAQSDASGSGKGIGEEVRGVPRYC